MDSYLNFRMKDRGRAWCFVAEVFRKRYELRRAAGVCWLLDLEQEVGAYKKPMAMNSIGARIWELLDAGKTVDEAARLLSEEYEENIDEVRKDVAGFAGQLEAWKRA